MKYNKDFPKERAVAYRDGFQNSILGQYMDSSEQSPVVTSMNLDKNCFLLDAGCGTGRYLANAVPEQPIVGLDLSIEMLKVAREDLKRGFFVVGELENMPFKDNVFNEVISVRVLQHIIDQQKAISEMSRVCKVTGNVIILSYNSWSLLSLYKAIRMSNLGKVINYFFRFLPVVGSGFAKWSSNYDNYCSLPELAVLFKKAGMVTVERKGGTIGFPWVFWYFGLRDNFQRFAPGVLRWYFRVARVLEDRLGSVFPFKYLMDLVIIKGIKREK